MPIYVADNTTANTIYRCWESPVAALHVLPSNPLYPSFALLVICNSLS